MSPSPLDRRCPWHPPALFMRCTEMKGYAATWWKVWSVTAVKVLIVYAFFNKIKDTQETCDCRIYHQHGIRNVSLSVANNQQTRCQQQFPRKILSKISRLNTRKFEFIGKTYFFSFFVIENIEKLWRWKS